MEKVFGTYNSDSERRRWEGTSIDGRIHGWVSVTFPDGSKEPDWKYDHGSLLIHAGEVVVYEDETVCESVVSESDYDLSVAEVVVPVDVHVHAHADAVAAAEAQQDAELAGGAIGGYDMEELEEEVAVMGLCNDDEAEIEV